MYLLPNANYKFTKSDLRDMLTALKDRLSRDPDAGWLEENMYALVKQNLENLND